MMGIQRRQRSPQIIINLNLFNVINVIDANRNCTQSRIHNTTCVQPTFLRLVRRRIFSLLLLLLFIGLEIVYKKLLWASFSRFPFRRLPRTQLTHKSIAPLFVFVSRDERPSNNIVRVIYYTIAFNRKPIYFQRYTFGKHSRV